MDVSLLPYDADQRMHTIYEHISGCPTEEILLYSVWLADMMYSQQSHARQLVFGYLT